MRVELPSGNSNFGRAKPYILSMSKCRCYSRVNGWEAKEQPNVHAVKYPWKAPKWPVTKPLMQCNKYANETIDKDINIKQIK